MRLVELFVMGVTAVGHYQEDSTRVSLKKFLQQFVDDWRNVSRWWRERNARRGLMTYRELVDQGHLGQELQAFFKRRVRIRYHFGFIGLKKAISPGYALKTHRVTNLEQHKPRAYFQVREPVQWIPEFREHEPHLIEMYTPGPFLIQEIICDEEKKQAYFLNTPQGDEFDEVFLVTGAYKPVPLQKQLVLTIPDGSLFVAPAWLFEHYHEPGWKFDPKDVEEPDEQFGASLVDRMMQEEAEEDE